MELQDDSTIPDGETAGADGATDICPRTFPEQQCSGKAEVPRLHRPPRLAADHKHPWGCCGQRLCVGADGGVACPRPPPLPHDGLPLRSWVGLGPPSSTGFMRPPLRRMSHFPFLPLRAQLGPAQDGLFLFRAGISIPRSLSFFSISSTVNLNGESSPSGSAPSACLFSHLGEETYHSLRGM